MTEKTIFSEYYNSEMFNSDFKKNRVPIQCWGGVVDDINQNKEG